MIVSLRNAVMQNAVGSTCHTTRFFCCGGGMFPDGMIFGSVLGLFELVVVGCGG